MSITYYTVIRGSSSMLDEEVNKKFSEGYYLYENPYSIALGENGYLCQAMIKDTNIKEEK